VSLLAFLALAAASPQAEKATILDVVHHMEDAWNRGDFRSYMAGFKNPDVVFVSGGKFQDGWQGTLDHYVRDYGGSAERRGKTSSRPMQRCWWGSIGSNAARE